MKSSRTFAQAEEALRRAALRLPHVAEDFPWGHRALKVEGKMFLVLATDGGTFRVSVKLPESNAIALSMPFAEPTGYGLGRSGWVTAYFTSPKEVPLPVLMAWLDESYRAIAPKRLSKTLTPVSASVEVVRSTPSRSRKPPSRRRR